MNPPALGILPQLVEIAVDPNSLRECTGALIVKGYIDDWEVTTHIAFHQDAGGDPFEIYTDDSVISGVLSHQERPKLVEDIQKLGRIMLKVLDASSASDQDEGRNSGVEYRAKAPEPVKTAMHK